jgi:hypothetical protein
MRPERASFATAWLEHETRAYRTRQAVPPGQQTGSKRLKSASLNHAELNREMPEKPHE